MARTLRLPVSFALLLSFSASLTHAVAPNLTTVTPAGGQRGSEVTVTLRGDRLADAQEIFFYRPGLTVAKITEAADKQVILTLTVAPDCPLGEHPLRLRTASGLSALRLFYVGAFPALEEKEPNNKTDAAQPVTLNTTIHGTIGAEDIDWFSVAAKKDQRLSVEIEGARLGRTMFDPIITVQDAAGKIVATSDDTPLLTHDGYVSFLVPADGKYLIQIRDMAYSGNGHVYRLHVGTFPRPAVASPLGGRAGDTLAVTFLGDPTGDFTQSLALPAPSANPTAIVPLRTPILAERDGLAASPNWLRVTAFPNADSVPAGPTVAAAPLLTATAPFAFHGTLTTPSTPDHFRFKAKKDQNLDFTVFARRLGSTLDSVLTVLDAKGKQLGNNDDAAGNPDSSLRVRIPEDGDYTVKIADQLGRAGPRFGYRVEVTAVRPTLVLSIPDTARYDYETRKSPAIPRGNRFAVLMNVTRDTFSGDLRVTLDGLPSGVTATSEIVPGTLSAVPVVFEAAADAPLAGALVTPTGVPTEEAKHATVASRYRHTVDWVRIQNDTVYVRSEVGQLATAVVEEVPFKISIVEPKVPLVQAGEMELKIVAERAEGFDEPITLKMVWNPPGVSAQPDLTIPKGATSIAYKLNATDKAEVRTWKTAVTASATVKGGLAHVSSQLAALEIAPGFLAGKIALTKVPRGGRAPLTVKLEQKIPFEGTAVARLINLPAHTTAQPVEITSASTEIVFDVVASDKAQPGLSKTLACNVVITKNGEPISQTIASASLIRIDTAKPATLADAKK